MASKFPSFQSNRATAGYAKQVRSIEVQLWIRAWTQECPVVSGAKALAANPLSDEGCRVGP